MKPSAARILSVLRDGNSHSGVEFAAGQHGFFCLSYSQRIGELKRAGHRIESICDGGVAVYRLHEEVPA